MGAFLAAAGGFLKDRIENKLANKHLSPSQQPDPSQPGQPPDPVQDTMGYMKYRAQHTPLGQAISGGMNRYRQYQAGQAQPEGMPLPQPEPLGDPDLAGVQPDMMAHGRMVTKPTLALIGERGPEAVVPMNANPNNKVSMPPTPGILRPPEIPQPHYPRYRR